MFDPSSALLNSNLKLRLLSAFVLMPVVLGAVLAGGWPFFGLIFLVSALGLAEWLALTAPKLSFTGKTAIVAGALGLFLCFWLVGLGETYVLSGFLLAFFLLAGHRQETFSLAWAVLGIPYVVLSACVILYLRIYPERGLFLTLFLILTVWGTDIGAYFAGRIIGGLKLMPSISPNKTYAGLLGGMVASGIVGLLIAKHMEQSWPAVYASVAILIAFVAQVGDLFESYVKRRAGVKDSGNLIPGHGGILDRIDGLLFAAIFLGLCVGFGVLKV